MSKGCRVCAAWHDGRETGACGHWCHFAGAEDWDDQRGGDGQEGGNGE